MDTYGLNDHPLLRSAAAISSGGANQKVGNVQLGQRLRTEVSHTSAKSDRVTVSSQAKSLAIDTNSVLYTQRILELREAIGNNTLPIAPPQIAQTILADEVAKLRSQNAHAVALGKTTLACETIASPQATELTAPNP